MTAHVARVTRRGTERRSPVVGRYRSRGAAKQNGCRPEVAQSAATSDGRSLPKDTTDARVRAAARVSMNTRARRFSAA